MDPILEELEHLDRWLLMSVTPLQLQLLGIIIGTALNIPLAWAESRIPFDPLLSMR